ncbi:MULTISPECIES: glycosyl hydrolase family 18 protein [Paenibacillus]|uniref:glycosyl hydrolase family 18 protein n=1 Tax=Paenibacillus TaxID=44249 RepID=UPI0003E2C1B1|nr:MULTISPECIES: glycosyl hydrolase family 18 protein [Paenibacillus]ANA81893.1 glycosyl hydrolase [Paenibacillus glucanolyticus]ETT43318.1 hypothetical protein C169_01245 [Paenibacillus sp. FSL R5-808]
MRYRTVKWAATTVLVSMCAAVIIWWPQGKEKERVLQPPQTGVRLSAWITDWQWKTGITDLKLLAGGLEEIHLFAVYFNHQDELHITPDYLEALPKVMEAAREDGQIRRVLTIVNDRFNTDGSTVQKDADLVSRIVATPESRSRHIGDIVAEVTRHGFTGVELDYEKVRKEDWDNLSALYSELYERLRTEDLSLRIVLEPGVRAASLDLPKGPDYVLMAYNLHGGHSGPGPKADHAMIRELAEKLQQIPGEHGLALSLGGFDWAEGGKVTSLTEQRAIELANSIPDEPQRDPASGALYFEYTDDLGADHTVWYADGTTVAGWIETARASGIAKIAIWRLGDVGEDTLQQLNEISDTKK